MVDRWVVWVDRGSGGAARDVAVNVFVAWTVHTFRSKSS
jgi:hypothetical protein